MKILRISVKNIASLEGLQTVDFTREPLRTAALFAISGATGAGKSTLLDALCLSLYERTPRLNAVRGAVKLADGADSISQKDPANLLRRGTGEGFAEVAFVGVDGQSYTARWLVRRARNRPEGNLQNTEMVLFRGNVAPGTNGTIEQGGKKTEVLPVIAAKIGLTFEQFTRAVLLAQNDFATFLKADDKDRAEILQALTGTERFEAISVSVFARASAEQRAVDEIQNRLAGNAPLQLEARQEAETARANAENAWRETNDKAAALEAHATWFKQLAEFSQRAKGAEDTLREKIAARDGAAPRRSELSWTEEASRDARPLRDAVNRMRDETAAAEKTRATAAKANEEARTDLAEKKIGYAAAEGVFATAKSALENAKPLLIQARELDARLTPLADRLGAATRDREAAESNLKLASTGRDTLKAKRETAEREAAPLRERREALAGHAFFAPEASAWLHRLDHATSSRKSFEEAATRRDFCGKAEQAKTEAANTERAKEANTRETARTATTAFEQAEFKARQHDGEKIASARTAADAARTALRNLENSLRALDGLTGQATSVEAEIVKLKAANEADGKLLAELEGKQIPAGEGASEAARHAFEIAEAAVTDEAIRLREKLVDDQPCPVCGALDHPHSIHPPASEAAALRALRVDWRAKETRMRELREKAVGLKTACEGRIEQQGERTKDLAGLQSQLATTRAVSHEHPVAVAVFSLPPVERAAALTAQLTAQQEAINAADTADAARRAAEKTRDDLRVQKERAVQALEALEKRLSAFAEELAGLRVARENAVNAHVGAEKIFEVSLTELEPVFSRLQGARESWERDPSAFRKSFGEQTSAFITLEKRLDELAAIVREADAALIPAGEAFTRAESEAVGKRTAEKTAREAHETVRVQRAGLLTGRAATEVEAELTESLRRAEETRHLRAGELEKANTLITATGEKLKGAAEAWADSASRHATAVAALQDWINGFANRIGRLFDPAELETILARDEAWIKNERAALEAMESAISNAQGALTVRQKEVGEHSAKRPTPEDEATVSTMLTALRPTLKEVEERRDSARAFLLADDQRIKDNAALAENLRQQQLKADPWLKLNELIGSADGAKFRSIAQRRTLDILLGYANAQLYQLAARYRLERLPESLNLIVIDRDMGDERRSVHSLSGGESFLVSLALALALASLTSNRLRIESLFIDEGFGSLDAETLTTAMNALMHLEAQGRKVGVISHVSEMTDAIPVQIRVVKGRAGNSRVIVPGAPNSEPIAESIAELVKESLTVKSSASLQEIGARLLGILTREQAAGRMKVSTRALREEIGCALDELAAARESLTDKVRVEGKSLTLN